MNALWLCGAPCVGKSVVGWEVFAALSRAGLPTAYVDLAQLGFCHPGLDGPDQHWLRAHNLAVAWSTYRSVGVRYLVCTGEAEGPKDVQTYVDALPELPFTVCRLDAGAEQLTERVLARGQGLGPPIPGDVLRGRDPAELRGFAAEAGRRAEALARLGIGDLVVDTDGRSISEVADQVRRDWLSTAKFGIQPTV